MNAKRSLRTQMLFQYVALVLVCMLIIPMTVSWLLNRQFRRFADEKLAEDKQQITTIVSRAYTHDKGWNAKTLAAYHGEMLRWPMVRVVIQDKNGKFLRALNHVPRHGNRDFPGGPDMLKQGNRPQPPKRPSDQFKNIRRRLVTSQQDLKAEGKTIGRITFFIQPFKDSREGMFLRTFTMHMASGVGIMILIAVIIAFIMTSKISRPVLDTAKRASLISKGDYHAMSDQLHSDITEIQVLIDSVDRLGLELEEQEKLRKRLMSDIAHELRNPITVVKSHLEAFEDGVWNPTPERLRLTRAEVDRLSLLISEVEKLTTIENAGNNLAISVTNLSELFEKTALTFDPLFANKSVKLEKDIQDGIEAAIDPAKIRQVTENLVSNALRYTDSGGTVTLALKRVGSNAVMTVKDNGIGISKEDLPNIFERFYRTDKSRARESGGIGIGLAIVKAIVEAHDGTIEVESKEGRGSTFTVTLPLGPKYKTEV
jgi:two-component system sensor histidine kinase BaeS